MDIDVTYVLQLGLFLFCLVALNGLILRPFLKIFQQREQLTDGRTQQVQQLTKLGDADMEAYRERMRAARGAAQRARDGLKNEGRESERALLADVRADIADKLNQARQRIAQSEAEARATLADDTTALARSLVAKVLDREVSV